jgi:hypothetical protein
MEPEKPSYFFAPLDSPVGGPIALGSLIEQPKFAASPLNRKPVAIADTEVIKPSPRSEYHLKTGKTVGGSVGLWADFLGPILGVGGNASIDLKKTTESDISCDLLETRYFVPATSYIEQSIADTNVKRWMTQHKPWFGHSKLFMVTGIKIAYNASFAYKVIKERGTKFHFGIDGTNSGVPLSIGPDADLRNDKSREESFKIVEPFVMAYRINKIEVRLKTGNVVSNQPHTDGAALGVVQGDDGKEIEVLASIVQGNVGVGDVETAAVDNELEDEDGVVCRFAHS